MVLKKVADLIALMVSENLRETISFTCIKLRKAALGVMRLRRAQVDWDFQALLTLSGSRISLL